MPLPGNKLLSQDVELQVIEHVEISLMLISFSFTLNYVTTQGGREININFLPNNSRILHLYTN